MAENQPQPPPGFQRPGVPGAGNILDPAVRGDLREKLKEAVQGAAPQPGGAAPPAETPADSEAAPAQEPAPAPATHRAGPYPHGDVDLSGFTANVPPGPVRPNRGKGGRRFYFLTETPAEEEAAPPPPSAAQPTDVRKPG